MENNKSSPTRNSAFLSVTLIFELNLMKHHQNGGPISRPKKRQNNA